MAPSLDRHLAPRATVWMPLLTALALVIITQSGFADAAQGLPVSCPCEVACCTLPCSSPPAALRLHAVHISGSILLSCTMHAALCRGDDTLSAGIEGICAELNGTARPLRRLDRMPRRPRAPGSFTAQQPRTQRLRTTAAVSQSHPPMHTTARPCSARSTAAGASSGASRCAATTAARRPAARAWHRSEAVAAVRFQPLLVQQGAHSQSWQTSVKLTWPCNSRSRKFLGTFVCKLHMPEQAGCMPVSTTRNATSEIHACLSQSHERAWKSSSSMAARPRCGAAARALPSRCRASTAACAAPLGRTLLRLGRCTAESARTAQHPIRRGLDAVRPYAM